MEVHPFGTKFHVGKQMDKHDKANSCFSQLFCVLAKIQGMLKGFYQSSDMALLNIFNQPFTCTLFFSVLQQPKSSLGHLIVLDHTMLDTNTWWDSCEQVSSSSQRLLPALHTTNLRDKRPCSQQNSGQQSQQSSSFRHTPLTAWAL